MKTQEWMYKKLFATLAELQSGTTETNPGLDKHLRHDLELLYDILDDEVPEEYWEQIEKEIDKAYE